MVELYFKDKKLGTLDYKNKVYSYSSIIENENYAKEQYFLALTDYDLFNSCDLKSEYLFRFFERIVTHIKKRQDLVSLLNITSFDSSFSILTKLPTFLVTA